MSSLTNIDMLSLDTSNVSDMSSMFNGCSALGVLNMVNFNTANVTSMNDMFSNMGAFEQFTIGKNFEFVGDTLPLPDANWVAGSTGKIYASSEIPGKVEEIYTICSWNEAQILELEEFVAELESQIATLKNRNDALETAISTAYNLDVTAAKGGNYSSVSADAYLIGDTLRVNFDATRSSSTSGNITNETVMTITVNHGGRIAGAYNVSLGSGTTGPVASFQTGNMSVSGNTMSFTITNAAIATSGSSWNSYFIIPVELNLDKY